MKTQSSIVMTCKTVNIDTGRFANGPTDNPASIIPEQVALMLLEEHTDILSHS